MEKVTKKQFANSVIWKFTDIMFRKIIGFIIAMLLARLIEPEAYGIIALTTVFYSIFRYFYTQWIQCSINTEKNNK